eukprot:gnl/TRDRNA2_/TRDRNA2_42420_c0_seq1.p1 gnl/TRDRNA2_/TRDRNA2_42420_c0~~gnl/TRDRNA2_/TRDRNA2_42420_c0_seq1.p1  ORF type:complete len:502 (-),score=106.92 gnl/TRDRNA2_/TRDRNA2_42420_c0_seq1:101-1567(-)
MVDVKLEAVDAVQQASDLYLSLRVGDVQKLSKLSAVSTAKTYKFPTSAVGDRRYGKLEIYRRIGGCSVSIDPSKLDGLYELAVPVTDSSMGNAVKFKVALNDKTGALTAKDSKPDGKDMQYPNVVKAKEYLEKHQLESRLSEAMQAVLREQPADPGAFVAQMMVSGAGMMTRLDKPKEEKAAAPVASSSPAAQAPAAPAPGAPAVAPSNLSYAALPGHLPKVVDYSSFHDKPTPIAKPYGGCAKEWSYTDTPGYLAKVVDYSLFTDKPVTGPYGGGTSTAAAGGAAEPLPAGLPFYGRMPSACNNIMLKPFTKSLATAPAPAASAPAAPTATPPKPPSPSALPGHLPKVVDYSSFHDRPIPIAKPYGGCAKEWGFSDVPKHLPTVVDYSLFNDRPKTGPYGGEAKSAGASPAAASTPSAPVASPLNNTRLASMANNRMMKPFKLKGAESSPAAPTQAPAASKRAMLPSAAFHGPGFYSMGMRPTVRIL